MLLMKGRGGGMSEAGGETIPQMAQSFAQSFPELSEEVRKYQAAKTRLMDRLKVIITVAAITFAVMLGSWGVWKIWPEPDPMAAARAEAAVVAQLVQETQAAYQLAQSEIGTTHYLWATDQNSHYKVQQTIATNGNIAKYNTLRNKLPETARQSFPALEYLSGR